MEPLPNPQITRSARIRVRTLILAVVFAGLVGGFVGAGAVNFFLPGDQAPLVGELAPQLESPDPVSIQFESAVTRVVESVGPAVVTVINHLP